MLSEKIQKSNLNIIQALLVKLSDFFTFVCDRFIHLVRREEAFHDKYLLPAGSAHKLIGPAAPTDQYSGPIKIRKRAL